MIYVLEKSYILKHGQILKYEYSNKPFDVHKVKIDYEDGMQFFSIYKTLNLPVIRHKLRLNEQLYEVGNPLTDEEHKKEITELIGSECIGTEDGSKYKVKKHLPKNLRSIIYYDGCGCDFVEPDDIIIPLVDVVDGHWIENFSKNNDTDVFADLAQTYELDEDEKDMSDEYKAVKERWKTMILSPQYKAERKAWYKKFPSGRCENFEQMEAFNAEYEQHKHETKNYVKPFSHYTNHVKSRNKGLTQEHFDGMEM